MSLLQYHWDPEKYIRLVEGTSDPILQDYMKTEIEYIIRNVKMPSSKTFVEVGAGYGRVIPQLSKIGKNVLAVEINKKMLKELKKRAKNFTNVTIIEGDANQLTKLLSKYNDIIEKPVLLSLQNTLGTIIGDPYNVLAEMKKIAIMKKGEIIISLFCQESLKDWGVKMYKSLQEMVGEIDIRKTDFTRGIFISKTGYKSKWWTLEERKDFEKRLDGKISILSRTPYFYIIHSQYTQNKKVYKKQN
jgi:ubiquinone/menaquinone biosynthesis C-methylase UbiE